MRVFVNMTRTHNGMRGDTHKKFMLTHVHGIQDNLRTRERNIHSRAGQKQQTAVSCGGKTFAWMCPLRITNSLMCVHCMCATSASAAFISCDSTLVSVFVSTRVLKKNSRLGTFGCGHRLGCLGNREFRCLLGSSRHFRPCFGNYINLPVQQLQLLLALGAIRLDVMHNLTQVGQSSFEL